MKIWAVGQGYDTMPILCLTKAIAERKAAKEREAVVLERGGTWELDKSRGWEGIYWVHWLPGHVHTSGYEVTIYPEEVLEDPALGSVEEIRSLLGQSLATPFFETREEWDAWCREFRAKVERALGGGGPDII